MTTPIIDVPAGLTAEQAAIVAASQQVFQAQQQQLRAQLAAALIAVWAGVANAAAFNPQAAAKFVSSILPISLGAQRAMSAITVAQMNRLVGPPTPITVAPDTVTGAALRQRDPLDYYERPFREVKWRLSQGKTLGQALDAGRRRAESIALTDLQLAHTHTARSYLTEARERTARRREAWRALPPRERAVTPRPTTGSAGTVVGYRRVLSANPNHCALCVLASTQRYHRENLMPIHPGCVLEGTRVSADDVAVATRRWYEGPVVVLRTAGGQELTVTPNHPVLTDVGWVPAQLLREGDHIARRVASQRPVDRGPYENETPTLVEDVWGAIGVAGFDRVPLAPEHFHSDGGDGEVHVVWTDGHLAPIGDVYFAQHFSETFLMGGYGTPTTDLLDRTGSLDSLLDSRLPSSGRDVRLERLQLPFFGRGLFIDEPAGGLSSTNSYTGIFQQTADRLARDAVLLAEPQYGSPVFVLPDHSMTWQLTPGVAAERLDAPAVEFAGEGLVLHAQRGRRLLDRLAGEVELDRLVLVDHRHAASHVYNLQTGEGHYTANGLIVSNCGCTVAPVFSTEDRAGRQVLDPSLLQEIDNVIRRDLGEGYVAADGRSGAALYRDIVVTNEHGELGPVLGVRGQHFERDPSRPGRLGNVRVNPEIEEPPPRGFVDLDALRTPQNN